MRAAGSGGRRWCWCLGCGGGARDAAVPGGRRVRRCVGSNWVGIAVAQRLPEHLDPACRFADQQPSVEVRWVLLEECLQGLQTPYVAVVEAEVLAAGRVERP